MTVEDRGVTLRDFVIFQVKLLIDGSKDAVVFGVSIAAIVLDFIAGNGRRPRLFYSVMRLSERFDRWLDLHSSIHRVEAEERDSLIESTSSTSDPLIEKFDQLIRKSDAGAKPGAKPPSDPL